jgi:hypothetical protein
MSVGKKPESLTSVADMILNGNQEEKEKLKGRHFHVADTPEWMKSKNIGITGEYFTVGYGVIKRHKSKDADHDLTVDNWIKLCDAIKSPFAIIKYREGFRLFTNAKLGKKYIVAGVDVKTIDRGIGVNSIATVFGYNERNSLSEVIIYRAKKITSGQAALLEGLNSHSLPPDQEADT